jgi:hypothetical protein
MKGGHGTKNRKTAERRARNGQIRWGGCRPTSTASQCARISSVCGHLSKKDGNHDGGWDDWGGSGKECFSASRSFDEWRLQYHKKLSRQALGMFMAEQPPAVVVMKARGSAHCRARELIRPGHDVKLIAAQQAKPFVKRQKNVAADADTKAR